MGLASTFCSCGSLTTTMILTTVRKLQTPSICSHSLFPMLCKAFCCHPAALDLSFVVGGSLTYIPVPLLSFPLLSLGGHNITSHRQPLKCPTGSINTIDAWPSMQIVVWCLAKSALHANTTTFSRGCLSTETLVVPAPTSLDSFCNGRCQHLEARGRCMVPRSITAPGRGTIWNSGGGSTSRGGGGAIIRLLD